MDTNSILITIKKMLGLDPDYHDFDMDVIISINSVLMALNQMGVGLDNYTVKDDSQTWSEFLEGAKNLEAVKTYVYLRVRKMFDPPNSSAVMEAYNADIKEFEWRLYMEKENERYTEEMEDNED